VQLRELFDRARDRGYWESLNPNLKISEKIGDFAKPVSVDPAVVREAKEDISTQGYLHTPSLLPKEHIDQLAKAVEIVTGAGWPTPFVFVYDNFWEIYQALEPVVNGVLGPGYILSPQIWCWHVKPNSKSSGWAGHRDRPEVNAVFPDGSPKTMTTWMPLTDATPLNGCMYVLPANLDPNYNLKSHELNIDTVQNVRALPAERGSMLAWTEQLLHWGSRSSDKAKHPRISLANTFQHPDVPLFDTPRLDAHKLLPFEQRLGLIAQNNLWHQERYHDPAEIVALCEKMCHYFPPIQFLNGEKQEMLEVDQHLSKSIIWSVQEDFSIRRGANSELNRHEKIAASTNSVRANSEMVIAFLQDYRSKLDLRQPLYLLELGADNGQFCYKTVNELMAKVADFESFAELQIRYILSHPVAKVVEDLRQGKKLANLQERELLDFAVFDAEKDHDIRLLSCGDLLNARSFKNPLIVLANNAFGMMKQDAFRCQFGDVQEIRWTHFRDCLDNPMTATQLRHIQRYFEIAKAHYDDANINAVLQNYRTTIENGKLFFPIGAMRSIAKLLELSNQKLIVLASDCGFVSDMPQTAPLQMRMDSGDRFSFPVNFDAIAQYVEKIGGSMLVKNANENGLTSAVAVIMPEKINKFESLRHCFNDLLVRNDSINSATASDALVLQPHAAKNSNFPITIQMLTHTHSSGYEPHSFQVAFEAGGRGLEEELRKLDADTLAEVLSTLKKVESNLSFLDKPADSILDCYLCMKRFEECAAAGAGMLEAFGPHRIMFDRLAMAYEGMERFELALSYFQQAAALETNHQWAEAGAERMRKKLGRPGVANISVSIG
jgi:tetratricopeptide (TPR) repeat protein/ectoine hydroxylase-related dioxygenase (phytanoyl-CoA dioxygenase family)